MLDETGSSFNSALDIDCCLTVDGGAMTKDYGKHCTAYRESVRARAGVSNSDADLGFVCE